MQYESELDSQGSQESENEEELLIERDENINCDKNDDSYIYPSELDGNYLKPKCVFSDPFTKTQREMNVIMNDVNVDSWRGVCIGNWHVPGNKRSRERQVQ